MGSVLFVGVMLTVLGGFLLLVTTDDTNCAAPGIGCLLIGLMISLITIQVITKQSEHRLIGTVYLPTLMDHKLITIDSEAINNITHGEFESFDTNLQNIVSEMRKITY